MKTILVIGDSLTYGARPDRQERHARSDRWPVVLSEGLGDEVEVITEALNGRTTAFADPQGAILRSAAEVLPTLLHSHAPLDLVVVMLGVNDIFVSEVSARAAQRGMKRLVEIIRNHPWYGPAQNPRVLLVSPPAGVQSMAGDIPEAAIAETAQLGPLYAALAEELGVAHFDAAGVAAASSLDGVHLDAVNTRAIGAALVPVVEGLFRGR